MNHLTYPYPAYPMAGDVQSNAGSNKLVVVGLDNIPLDISVGSPASYPAIINFSPFINAYVASDIRELRFSDDEIVSGSGTSWTLLHTPIPTESLQLFQIVGGVGGVLLFNGTDYTLSGTTLTTVSSISVGDLRAWYRY